MQPPCPCEDLPNLSSNDVVVFDGVRSPVNFHVSNNAENVSNSNVDVAETVTVSDTNQPLRLLDAQVWPSTSVPKKAVYTGLQLIIYFSHKFNSP